MYKRQFFTNVNIDCLKSNSAPAVSVNEPPKITKAAQKRAARQARQQPKQEKKAKQNASASVSTASSPTNVENPLPPGSPGSQTNPVEILPETESEMSAVLVDAEPVSEGEPVAPAPAPALNGHAPYSNAPLESPRVQTSPTSSKPPAFPTSPVDLAMRKASQSLAVNPLSRKTEDIEKRPKEQTQTSDLGDKEAAEKTKKRQSFFVRTLWTLIMIGGFLCRFRVCTCCI